MFSDVGGSLKYKKHNPRSNSINANLSSDKILKLAGKTTLQFPKRERFNEDSQDIIEEQKSRLGASGLKTLTNKNLNFAKTSGPDDLKSQLSKALSRQSNKSLTKSELTKFFAAKKQQAEDDAKSRLSQISKGSGFKARFLRRIEDNKDLPRNNAIAEKTLEHTYETDEEFQVNRDDNLR
mmetsp:Transcript_3431/g.5825  ORF Transcript_3431/g.5825 Transcript_3431/m.5825 type:complete len:180 (-) Transcript_3431:295-834(-)